MKRHISVNALLKRYPFFIKNKTEDLATLAEHQHWQLLANTVMHMEIILCSRYR